MLKDWRLEILSVQDCDQKQDICYSEIQDVLWLGAVFIDHS